ncbi:MAG: GNAT family N-acetyltransferase [Planctomycetota bacterium]|nr:MAG: GNAT family N-acetyltransferase [Planctomycetota bacterium]
MALRGAPPETRAAAERVCAALDTVLWVGEGGVAPGRTKALLGQSFAAVVLDAHEGLDADVLGRCQGLVRGGGALVLRLPPRGAEPRLERLAVFPHGREAVGTRFWARLEAFLSDEAVLGPEPEPEPLPPLPAEGPRGTEEQARAVEELCAAFLAPEPRLVALVAERGRGKSSALGLALARALAQAPLRVAVTAPSEAAAAEVFRFAPARAPGLEFLAPDALLGGADAHEVVLVDEAAQFPIPFLRALLRRRPRARMAFATTTQGYEGTGRGFVLRFLRDLAADPRPLVRPRLRAPVRWAAGDPLERWVHHLLLLDVEPPGLPPELAHAQAPVEAPHPEPQEEPVPASGGEPGGTRTAEPEDALSRASSPPPQARGAAGADLLAGAAAPAPPPPEDEKSPTVRADPGPPLCDREAQERLAEAVFAAWARRAIPNVAPSRAAGPLAGRLPPPRRLDRDALACDERLLRSLFALLVHAHYRTTPGDLLRLLDAPNLAVHAVVRGDKVLAATLIAREGGLAPETCAELAAGRWRIRGHALADTLVVHSARPEAGELSFVRSVRIATHPALRRRGLARALVEHVHATHRPDLFGTLFGATPELLAFRHALGYRVVRLGLSRSARSGEPSVVLLRPESPRGAALFAALRDDFARDLPFQLDWLAADSGLPMAPALVQALGHELPTPPPLSLQTVRERFARCAHGPQPLEAAAAVVARFFAEHPERLAALSPSERLLLLGRVRERRSWRELAAATGYPTVPTALAAARRALRRLRDA